MERRFAGLICLLTLLLAACNGGPTPLTGDVNLDLGDPNVGGGVGIVLPGETLEPLPGSTPDLVPRDVAPRSTAALPASATDLPVSTVAPTPTARPEQTATVETLDPTPEPDAATEPSPVETTAESPPEAAAETPPEATPRPTTHIVAVGENLYRIGLQYGLSYVALAEYNGITNVDQISVGQELQIPPAEDIEAESTPEATAEPAATATATVGPTATAAATEATPAPEPTADATVSATPSAGQTHKVLPGENLYRISQQYDISWVLIAEANGLISPNQITVGQVLKIPTNAPGPAPQITHQVRAGESLFRIALQYGVPLSAVVEANGLQVPYVIYPGQVLVIPGQGE